MTVPMRGTLTLLCGPMFAGKSTELLRRLRAARASATATAPSVSLSRSTYKGVSGRCVSFSPSLSPRSRSPSTTASTTWSTATSPRRSIRPTGALPTCSSWYAPRARWRSSASPASSARAADGSACSLITLRPAAPLRGAFLRSHA
ncbi:MAG: hypothetical protein FJ260_00810 [Planctomycetes bacterium]|nr:hypothetical protein [Planctomycetota bacterium]